jgi:hypothetical protein
LGVELCGDDVYQSQDNVISTPELKGTILPGITRKSIVELAGSCGYKVSFPWLVALHEIVSGLKLHKWMDVVSEDHDRLYCVEQVFTKYENNKPAKLLLQLCLVMVSILLEYHAVCTGLHISIDSCTGSLIKQVFERPVDVEELLAADEVFCTGTAVVVNPVGSITYESRR